MVMGREPMSPLARIMGMRLSLLCLCLLLAAPARAGTFDLAASVDRDRLELGESLQLKLAVKIDGQLAFPPQLEQPQFDGFQAQGPQQMQNVQWVNGAMSMEVGLVWELTAVKAGTLTLGPFEVHAKDPATGEIRKRTQPITVRVTRPKGLSFPGAQPQPTIDLSRVPGAQGPEEEALRDIKPDRPFPWHWAALGALAGLGALFGLLTWWRRRPKGPPPLPGIREPGQWALEQLEKARQGLAPGGEAGFVLRAGGILHEYLRQRLQRGPDLTLQEGLRLAGRRAASLGQEAELGPRLARILYGGVTPEPADADWAYAAVRAYVVLAERAWPRDEHPDQPPPRRAAKSRQPQS